MDVRILGPMEVEVGGVPRRLGPQLQTVLAVLVLAAGRVVARRRLVELVWGEPAPDAADTTLRSHVLHLRRLLEPDRVAGAAPRTVITEGPGYALRLRADELDAARFERLVERGRQALGSGDPAAAGVDLRGALALWRGPVLAGIGERSFALAQAARLDELRQAAERDLVEADLAAGRCADVVPELTGLLAGQPHDERLRLLLATALYRSDRAHEALRICRDGLRLLHDRGLRSTALQRMQQDILRQAPALGGRATVRPSGRQPLCQLPPDVAEFTGRTAEVEALRAALIERATAAIATIDGKPGIGKSALAVHVAHTVRDRFPGGVLYADLGGETGHRPATGEVLDRFLRALGVPDDQTSADQQAASATYRSALADRGVLVVLDNAVDAGQVRPLLPATGGCAALVTSRRPLVDLDSVLAITLDLLADTDAVALLATLAGRTRVSAEPEAALALVRRCGLLPLAVRIAGARLRARPAWSLATLADRLADERRRLAELTIGDLAVRSSFLLSYRELDVADAELFRLLGLLDTADLTPEVAAALAARPADDVEWALERLVDVQLLETTSPGRYRFHDLLRLFARERAELEQDEPGRRAALTAAVRWYLRRAEQATSWLAPPSERVAGPDRFVDRAAALDWLDAERGNLVAAARHAADLTDDEPAWRLTEVLQPYFDLRKHWPQWHAVCERGLAAARAAGDLRAQGRMLRQLGEIEGQQRHYRQAVGYLERALRLARRCGDRWNEACALNNLGLVHCFQQRFDSGIELIERGLAAFTEIGDRVGQAKLLNNLAHFHSTLGDFAGAARRMRECLAIDAGLGDDAAVGADLETLGRIHQGQHRFAEAIDCYRRSLPLLRANGDRHNEANALHGLGVSTAALHGADAGRPLLAEALAIFTDLHAPEADDVRALLDG